MQIDYEGGFAAPRTPPGMWVAKPLSLESNDGYGRIRKTPSDRRALATYL
jgi:hypothetical protein